MSDEVGMVVKCEMDGVTYAIKASVKVAQFIANLLKSVMGYAKQKKLELPGEHKLKDIIKLSEGDIATFHIPEGYVSEMASRLKSAGVPFSMLADLNKSDGKAPIAVPSQFSSVTSSICKDILSMAMSESDKVLQDTDKKINENREKLLHASPSDRSKLNREIEHLQKSKEEVEKLLSGFQKDFNKDDLSMSFSDYLASGRGTTAEKDPSGVLKSMEKGGESVQYFDAKDVFEPIRSTALVPDSKVSFIIPETGSVVTRKFEVDDNGIVYSLYSFKDKFNRDILDDNGKPVVFSDRDVTTEEWMNGSVKNANVKEMYDLTGISEGTVCEYYSTELAAKAAIERLTSYQEDFHKLAKKKESIRDDSFSSDEVANEVRQAASDDIRGRVNAELIKDRSVFEVSSDHVYNQYGFVVINDDSLGSFYFRKVDLESVDDSITKFSVSSDYPVMLRDKDDKEIVMSAKDAMSMINSKSESGVTPNISEVAGKGKDR